MGEVVGGAVGSKVGNLAGSQACPLGLLMPSFPGHTSAHLGCESGGERRRQRRDREGETFRKGKDGKIAMRAACEEIREGEPCSATSLTSPASFSQLRPCQPHINTVNLWKVSLLSGGSPSLLAHFISVYLAPDFLFLF